MKKIFSNINDIDDTVLEYLKNSYGIVGTSQAIKQAILILLQSAETDLTVLIMGETGTGKEVFANAIHKLSKRKKYPFVSVNCGAIPETLLESELFGHEKGAYTSANETRKGFFEVADKGTIFLDEIGELPYSTQVKLLRVLEYGEFSALGSSEIKKVDVRIVAATNRNLEEEVRNGNFRQDLYYRLKNVIIYLPPLRERIEDISILANYFWEKKCRENSIEPKPISREANSILESLPWFGNVRELKNLIDTIVSLEKTDTLTAEILLKYLPPALPEFVQKEQPREVSLIPISKIENKDKFELEIIFRSLLELKSDLYYVKQQLYDLSSRVDELNKNLQILNSSDYNIKNEAVVVEQESLNNISNLKEAEKLLIIQTLQKNLWNKRKTAKELGISERTLYRKLEQLKIKQ